jgi:hypothetical protein
MVLWKAGLGRRANHPGGRVLGEQLSEQQRSYQRSIRCRAAISCGKLSGIGCCTASNSQPLRDIRLLIKTHSRLFYTSPNGRLSNGGAEVRLFATVFDLTAIKIAGSTDVNVYSTEGENDAIERYAPNRRSIGVSA